MVRSTLHRLGRFPRHSLAFGAMKLVALGLVCGLAASAHARPKRCDASGNWKVTLAYQNKDCDPDVLAAEEFAISKSTDDRYYIQAQNTAAISYTIYEKRGTCIVEIKQDIVTMINNHPDISRYTYTMSERGGKVTGKGQYQYVGNDPTNTVGCVQSFTITGTKPASGAPPIAIPKPTPTPNPNPIKDCPDGQVINDETDGFCCWVGQVWSTERKRCVGAPTSCPAGTTVQGERCVGGSAGTGTSGCSTGMLISADTKGHCCWPGQAYSKSRASCIGIPTACPAGMRVQGEGCVK